MKNRFRAGYDLSVLESKKNVAVRDITLTDGIFDANIDLSQPGQIRVALWQEWRTMLEDLRRLGPVWRMARNSHAVLAIYGDYPELAFASDKAAHAGNGESAAFYHFQAWRQATAFASDCCCGPIHGLEIENRHGDCFHRICLTKNGEVERFVEWTQVHQATGLETPDDFSSGSDRRSQPVPPGTLEVGSHLLRTVLITAAQREIPLVAGVVSEGLAQTERINVERATENQGWLVLSGEHRSLYVETEPNGQLWLEPRSLEGEPIWSLSLVHPEGRCRLRLQTVVDHRLAWNRLVQEILQ